MLYEFRGKSLADGEWVYGDLEVNRFTGRASILTYHEDGTSMGSVTVDRETVGLYIGLQDRNGNKIFMGDIVKDVKTGWLGVVDWHAGSCCFYILEPCYSDCGVYPTDVAPIGDLSFFPRLEVVGNKWDNTVVLSPPRGHRQQMR